MHVPSRISAKPRLRRSASLTTLALLGALAAATVLPALAPSAQAQGGQPDYVAGELIVQFKADATDAERAAALARVAGRVRKGIGGPAARGNGVAGPAVAATGLAVPDAIRRLQNDPAVEFAEPNWRVTHQEVSTDTHYANGSLWGVYSSDKPAAGPSATTNVFGSQAEQSWAAGRVGSSNVYVGVIDEGIDVSHPDLVQNIWVNPGEIAGNGVDDDGNGYADDIHGWDFANEDSSVYDGPAGDTTVDSHGTHVAGTIGAASNGRGVVGVCWNVKMISAKFLAPGGGSVSDAVEAVRYFIDLKKNRGVNIVALNNSWGGGGYSQAMMDAIVDAAKEGILFVAAAGNSGRNTDLWTNYPSCYNTTQAAGYDSVIAVAAIDKTGSRPSWSNYGQSTVDLAAPGAGIVSTLPNGYLGAKDGTSMAAPHVTGAAALYAASRPGATAAGIRSAVLNAAAGTPTKSMSRKCTTSGRLNVTGF